MKKSITLILFFMLVSVGRANIATPQAYISEILVDSTGNWSIEMEFYEDPYIFIDSVWLVTSTGSSRINNFNAVWLDDYVFLGVITIADLANPVSINPESDFVQLISYTWDETNFSDVSFGNYPGSFLDCIQNGESVASVIGFYGMDRSPSIGSLNDTSGAMGNFSGIAYNLSGDPFNDGLIFIPAIPGLTIVLNTDGFFSERIVNRRYNFDTIIYYTAPPATYDYYTIDAINFCLRPDSSYSQDIITTSLVIGIDDKEVIDENIVTIAPNPFSEKVVFFFNLKNNNADKIDFSIHGLDGREIQHINLSPGQKKFEWAPSGNIPSGTYIYRLVNNNNVLKTGKFVRL